MTPAAWSLLDWLLPGGEAYRRGDLLVQASGRSFYAPSALVDELLRQPLALVTQAVGSPRGGRPRVYYLRLTAAGRGRAAELRSANAARYRVAAEDFNAPAEPRGEGV